MCVAQETAKSTRVGSDGEGNKSRTWVTRRKAREWRFCLQHRVHRLVGRDAEVFLYHAFAFGCPGIEQREGTTHALTAMSLLLHHAIHGILYAGPLSLQGSATPQIFVSGFMHFISTVLLMRPSTLARVPFHSTTEEKVLLHGYTQDCTHCMHWICLSEGGVTYLDT